MALENISVGRLWTVKGDGLYFVDEIAERPVLERLDLLSEKKEAVAALSPNVVSGTPGLSIAPDGQSVLYSERDEAQSDLMMLEAH